MKYYLMIGVLLTVFSGPNTFFRAYFLSTEGTYSYNAAGDFLH
jgi:hypothetical protein